MGGDTVSEIIKEGTTDGARRRSRGIPANVEKRFDSVLARMDDISARVGELSKRLDAEVGLQEGVRAQVRGLSKAVEQLAAGVVSMDDRLREVERKAHEPGVAALREWMKEIMEEQGWMGKLKTLKKDRETTDDPNGD